MEDVAWVPPTAEEAVALWGMRKLNDQAERWGKTGRVTDPSSVSVSFDFSEGYACCGGADPNCYCSMAESPRADVYISSHESGAEDVQIPVSDFDLGSIVREVIAAAGGLVSA